MKQQVYGVDKNTKADLLPTKLQNLEGLTSKSFVIYDPEQQSQQDETAASSAYMHENLMSEKVASKREEQTEALSYS